MLSNFDLVTASFTLNAGEEEFALFVHAIEAMNTCCRLFRNAADFGNYSVEPPLSSSELS